MQLRPTSAGPRYAPRFAMRLLAAGAVVLAPALMPIAAFAQTSAAPASGSASAGPATSGAMATPPALVPVPAPAGGSATTPTADAEAGPPAMSPAEATQTTAGTLQTKLGKEKAARIETHISSLHSALKITQAQEPLWQNFAATMRQNVVQMDAVYAKRQSGYGGMNAVQDLQSYGEVEETNARNVQQLLPTFQALYDSFTPDQKKTADTTFHRYTEKAVKKAG